MKLIDISTKKFPNTFTMVDDEDYEELNQYKWYAKTGSTGQPYAVRGIKIRHRTITIRMHRHILGLIDSEVFVDHLNCCGLDNRRENLRICTTMENLWNTPPKAGTSEYKGVSYSRPKACWRVQICRNYKVQHIGYFHDEEEAARAYDKKAIELFGEFAYLNFPEGRQNG